MAKSIKKTATARGRKRAPKPGWELTITGTVRFYKDGDENLVKARKALQTQLDDTFLGRVQINTIKSVTI